MQSLKYFFLLASLFLSTSSLSFTFREEDPPKYSGNEVVYNVANDNCSNIELSAESLLDLVEDAMERFWNSVPTTSIEFKRGSVRNISANGESVSDFINNDGEADTIIIGCNANGDNFGGDGSTLGVGTYGTNSEGMLGGFLINDSANSNVIDLGPRERQAVIAHELGHAFAIGHSNFDAALMSSQLNKNIDQLAQDDEDAITHLYPQEDVVACGNIAFVDGDNGPGGPGPGAVAFVFLLGLALTILPSLSQNQSR